MTNCQDAPGDRSHRALDVLLWRMFCEGEANLESLKHSRKIALQRLGEALEQAFFEVFGAFRWIERQFGGAFVVWLFEQVGYWGATEQLWNAFHNCSVAPEHSFSSL